ncbi:11335_t:CDS:2 [Racocetra fulgida]|uniref:11335_t:CDS:1 n=1 Tax=Racocetra fulgida TaxID=60492 RepID=A0A9N8YTY2_9GLOM|nr:11335_t:CDS:2 [Racocetra fulgida]
MRENLVDRTGKRVTFEKTLPFKKALEKINNNPKLFYGPFETYKSAAKLGRHFYFLGKEKEKFYQLLIPDNHPALALFPKFSYLNYQRLCYIEGAENIPLEKNSLEYAGNEYNKYHKLLKKTFYNSLTKKLMKKTEVEIVETNSQKIIFKTTYSWAFCLGANQENKFKHYSLPANALNGQKLQKIVPNYDFSATITNVPTIDIKFPSLRDYQLADVKFLSRLKSVAIFSEMRTGKTPISLMTFQQ